MKRFIFAQTAAFWLASTAAVFSCTDRETAIAAVNAGDFDMVRQLHEVIDIDPACDDAFRDWLNEALARETFKTAMATSDAYEKSELLNRSLDYFRHWRTLAELGNLAADQGDRTGEARFLQAALTQLNDGPERHAASEDEIKALFERATVAMRLADAAVVAPRTRSGELGGVFITSFRGFTVEEVDLAIEFEFDSTQMTPKGLEYAKQLLDHLEGASEGPITLEGHTDPVGGDAYNDDLSYRRAGAVKAYLEDNGFAGIIDLVGRGERDLPVPPAGIAPNSEEHFQIARRVVLIRG